MPLHDYVLAQFMTQHKLCLSINYALALNYAITSIMQWHNLCISVIYALTKIMP
jgi:hypothetical protein